MTTSDVTDAPTSVPTGPAGFERHREASPHVETALVRLLDEARAAGKTKTGMDMLWGGLRWQQHLRSGDEDDVALNNNWRSYWARYLMVAYPRFDGMFDLRRADDADQWQADYIARQHAREYDLPEDGSLFAIDVPQPRSNGYDL